MRNPVFTELVVSNITRLIDLPGTELAQLMGGSGLKLPGGRAQHQVLPVSNVSQAKEVGIVFCEGGRSQLLPGLYSEHLHIHGGVTIIVKHFLVILFHYMNSKSLSNIDKNYKNYLD